MNVPNGDYLNAVELVCALGKESSRAALMNIWTATLGL